jgi:hypothetical protein
MTIPVIAAREFPSDRTRKFWDVAKVWKNIPMRIMVI